MSAPSSVYVDTSALAALLIEQPDTAAVATWLDYSTATLVSSDLLETEWRRVAIKQGINQSAVTRLLDGVAIAALDRAVYRSAGILPMPYLRTLDALHLEAAIRLADAARSIGLDVITPDATTKSPA